VVSSLHNVVCFPCNTVSTTTLNTSIAMQNRNQHFVLRSDIPCIHGHRLSSEHYKLVLFMWTFLTTHTRSPDNK